MTSLFRAANRFRRLAIGFCLALATVTLANPTPLLAQRSKTTAMIGEVKAGGTVMLCRHAITARMQESEPVDYADSTTQRLLSPEGQRQSRRIGRALRTLEIPIARVVASPMQRARRTAEFMFDQPVVIDSIWHTNGSEYGERETEQRIGVLQTPVGGGNLVVISHIGTMQNALGRSPGNVGEGDCVIVRPSGDDFEIVGVVPWRAWIREAGLD